MMEETPERPTWRIETCDTGCPGWRHAALVVVGPDGSIAAAADLDGPAASTSVELSVQLVSERPPPAVVGELVRAAATCTAQVGATRMVVPLGPGSPVTHDVMDASGLDWRVLASGESACAEVTAPRPRRRSGHTPATSENPRRS
jgi:hypothetical protein